MKNIPLSIIAFLLVLSGYGLKSTAQTVEVAGTVKSSETIPKYAYLVRNNKRSIQKQQIVDNTFRFRCDDVLINNESGYERGSIALSDDDYSSYGQYTAAIQAGKLTKRPFFFIFDSTRLDIDIDLDNTTRVVHGGVLNEQQALRELIQEEHEARKKDVDMNENNLWKANRDLELVNKYAFSPVSVDLLRLLSLWTATHQDPDLSLKVRDVINQYSQSPKVDKQRIKQISDLFDETASRHHAKESFSFPTVGFVLPDGNDVDLEKISGGRQYVVIDFWATWCVPCLKEQPHFERITDSYRDRKNIRFIAISVDKKRSAWEEHTRSNPLPYASLWLDQQKYPEFMHEINIQAIPRYMIVDIEKQWVVKSNINIIALEETINAL